jgi:hypothetical protein
VTETTRHDLTDLECVTLRDGSGHGWGGACRCGSVFSALGQGLEARNEVLTEHRAHVAKTLTCTHPDAIRVDSVRGELVGWICPDCGDDIRGPALWGPISPELRADLEAIGLHADIEATRPGAPGERHSRSIPQDVTIAVSARDQGRCVECGSTQDLHYDHKIPWSRGGTNTVNNIQLMCGTCNRRKGASDDG